MHDIDQGGLTQDDVRDTCDDDSTNMPLSAIYLSQTVTNSQHRPSPRLLRSDVGVRWPVPRS
jgi:hypothetical protein